MSRNEDILRAIIYGGSAGERAAESRNEAILLAMLDVLNGEEVDLSHLPVPQSRFESLLLQVVRKLEEGGSGGGGGDSDVDINGFIDRTVEHIVIPDGVTTVGKWAFAQCVNVKSVKIADSVTTIQGGASFSQIGNSNGGTMFDIVANGLKTIDGNQNSSFGGCSYVRRIILPAIEVIRWAEFSGCTGVQYIYLGPNCKTIGNGAFSGVPITCKVECGFAEGAVDGFPANSGFAGNPASLDVTYNVPSPTV